MQGTIQQLTGSHDVYVWSQWFSKNGPEILAILAAVLGASLIAGEVSSGIAEELLCCLFLLSLLACQAHE